MHLGYLKYDTTTLYAFIRGSIVYAREYPCLKGKLNNWAKYPGNSINT